MQLVIALLVAFVISQLATLVTTLYLHRSLSHRSLQLSAPVEGTLRVLLWIMTGIRPRQWVAVHRKHHAFSDTEGDPHSPLLEGFATVQFGNVVLYRRALREDIVSRYARDLPPDRWDRALFDRAFLGLGIGIAALIVLLGPLYGIVAAVAHTATYLLLNAAINAIGHTMGGRPFPNRATNNRWLALLTAGEGLHNNHHAAPTSANFALRRGDVDPTWWLIRLLAWRGLARVRLSEDRVRERLELSAQS